MKDFEKLSKLGQKGLNKGLKELHTLVKHYGPKVQDAAIKALAKVKQEAENYKKQQAKAAQSAGKKQQAKQPAKKKTTAKKSPAAKKTASKKK